MIQTITSKIRSKNAITLPYIQWIFKKAAFIDRFYGQERERELENKKYYLEIIASIIE
jgi:hypothetical protein